MNFDVRQPDDFRLPRKLALRITWVVVGFACFNWIATLIYAFTTTGYSFAGELAGATFTGIVFGQGACLTFWAVFAPVRFAWRFLGALAVGLVLWGFGAAGLEMGGRGLHEMDYRGLFLFPLLAPSVAAPLGCLKVMLGCHLVPWWTTSAARVAVEAGPSGIDEFLRDASPRLQFNLSHILAATTYVAVSLGLVTSFADPFPDASAELWGGVLMLFVAMMFLSGLLTVPCVCAALMIRNPVRGIAIAAIQPTVTLVFLFGTPILLQGLPAYLPPFSEMAAVFLCSVLAIFSPTIMLFAALKLLQYHGYELMWPARMRRWAQRHADSRTGTEYAATRSEP